MDYDDNDFRSSNLHLAGEGNDKSPVLRPYDLPRFDFDDNLHGHLRFDSLGETEVFLGIESSEDNQWIEDFSRGSTGIAFSSSADEPCSISRRNVWSEAASSESVEMLLKSVGQDESILGKTISKDSDGCDELAGIIKQMEPSLKYGDSGISKVGDDLETGLQTGEGPEKKSVLKVDVSGDHLLVQDVSRRHEFDPSVDVALKAPIMRNTDLPERDESKAGGEQIVSNENQVEASVDQFVENSEQVDKFASGSQVDIVIPSVQNICASSAFFESQDSTHLKNDIVDDNVDLSHEVHIDGKSLIENAVASVTSHVPKHSDLDMQSVDDGHAIGNFTRPTVDEPSDCKLKENSDLPIVEECSEDLGVESPLHSGISKDIVLSVGNDMTPKPFVGDTDLKDQESEISNTDAQVYLSQESKLDNLDSMAQISCDAVEKKDLSERDCHSDTKILCSRSQKYLLSVEDGKCSKGEGDGAHDTLGAEPMGVDEKFTVTEHTDHNKFDQSVSASGKPTTELASGCSKTDHEEVGSPIVMKGIDSSSFGTGDTAKELASNLQSDVTISGKSVDCVLLASGTSLPAAAVFEQKAKEVQVSSPEASFSIMKISGITTNEGAPCETDGQSSGKKVDQSSMEDTSDAVGQSGDQTPHSVILEVVRDMHAFSGPISRESDGAEAQVTSKKGSSGPSDAVSIQENKTLTNSMPSTSKELSLPEDSDLKLLSEEISGHTVVPHADGDNVKTHNSSFTSAPSSKIHMMECGSSSADLGNPPFGSPNLLGTSEQPESKVETHTVEGSKNLSTLVSGVINGEASKMLSSSQDTKGNDASSGDKSFTSEVPPMENLSEKEASRNWQPFSPVQHDKSSSVVEGTPSTSGLTKVGPETAEKASHSNLQASERENVSGGSKRTSEHRTRRTGSKSSGKEAAKKRIAAKDTTPAKQSKRTRRTSNVSLSTAEIGQVVKSNEMLHFGNSEVIHQPFTDLQQVQLRAQIFVYGSLIQGSAPDEPYMIAAFGGPDGGSKWENVWRAYMERVHYPKSHLVSPEIPLEAHTGARTPDQSVKKNELQAKITSSHASPSNIRDTPTTIGKPKIPLSSPLWTIPTPSTDALQPSSIRRGAVIDYQQPFSPLHPPPTRNFVGHPWMSQSPFHGPWVPQSSDANAHFPVLPITEAVNLTQTREASMPNSSVMKQASPVPLVQSGSLNNVFTGTPLLDSNKATFRSGQHSADSKPRKRKKSTVSEDPGQIILHSQTESLLATLVNSHAASTTAAITIPAAIVSKFPSEKSITPGSADHLERGERGSDQKATLSEETLGKLKEAQKQAEDAAALAAAAVCHSQEIWNQLGKQKCSGLAPDVETKLTSAAVAIAAAAAVAKAAAAAANVASNTALQAKLMADEALVSSGCGNPVSTSAISSDSMKNLGKATPASILRGENASTSSNSVIVVAKEASRQRVEAASATSKRAENMDAIVKAAELAAEAVSQAGKIVMGEPFTLTELVEAGPEAYWKVPRASSEPDDAIREHGDKGGNVEAPGSFVEHPQEVPIDKRDVQSNKNEMSPILQEMTRESMQDHSRLTDNILGPAATSGNDKKGKEGLKASDIAKSKRMSTKTEHGKEEETSKDNNMTEGSHVEVLRDGGDLKVAWFLADILDLKDGKAYVCYNDLRSKDGDGLKEWVNLEGEGDRTPRIRSARPITVVPFEGTRKRRRAAAMGDYNWSVGDRVDSWMQDSWWEGVINEKSKKDETSFTVHFPAQGETSIVKAWLLRPSLMWKDGNWVEWSSSGDNSGSSHERDTPLEKRPRIGSPVAETKEEGTKSFDNKETEKPDDTRLVDLPAGEKIFNIGKCTRDESKPGSFRTKRSGLKQEGSRVIFGVPKPGKKRKFMDVSKHYVADQSSKTRRTNHSAKLPKGSDTRGTKNIIEPKENRMTVSGPKVLKSGKPPSVSSRIITQKDSLSSNVGSEPDDAVTANTENISEKHNLEFISVSSSDEVAEGPVIFSSATLSSDAKASTSNAKSGRISKKGKQALAPGKSAKADEEMRTASEASEPRRSNRKIQPTSRLLEGLQSSLIISKIPVPHQKGHKGQNRSTRGNDEDQD